MLISRLSSLKPASRLVVAMRLVAGLALLVIGVVLALPGIPGPGILIILLGLWLLSHHFAGPGELWRGFERELLGFAEGWAKDDGNGQRRAVTGMHEKDALHDHHHPR